MWVSFRLSLLLYLLRAGTFFFLIFPSSAPSRSPLLIPYLVPFRVRSLCDFVGSLPDELSLFPVRARQIYLRRTSSLSPRLRSLFVSPRSPSRSLSKNALSFFLRSVICLSLSLLPRLLLLPLVLTAFVPSLHRLLSLAMFPLPLFLLSRLGVLPLSSPLSICVTSSSLPLRGFLWVRWWRRMQLFNVLHLCWCWLFLITFLLFYGSISAGEPIGFPSSAILQSPGSHRRLSTWCFIHYSCGRCVPVVASFPSPI